MYRQSTARFQNSWVTNGLPGNSYYRWDTSFANHAIHTIEGVVKLVIDGKEVKATVGETTFVPAGTQWTYAAESIYSRAYVFANGAGIGGVLTTLGSKYTSAVLPQAEEVTALDETKLKGLETELKFTVI